MLFLLSLLYAGTLTDADAERLHPAQTPVAQLQQMATLLEEAQKYNEAIEIYQKILRLDPLHPEVPDYQNKIIHCYQKMDKTQESLDEVSKLIELLRPTSAWSQKNPAALAAAQDHLEATLRSLANTLFTNAKKLRTGPLAQQNYQWSRETFERYFQEFPHTVYFGDMHYAYAELLYTIKDFEAAYTHYMLVVNEEPQNSHAHFCAESAIFAAQEMAKKETPNPTALTEAEQKKLAAINRFLALWPTDAKAQQLQFARAYLYYNKKLYSESIPFFLLAIEANPASKESQQAAHLVLDSLTQQQEWAALKEVAKAFLEIEGLGDASFYDELKTTYRHAKKLARRSHS